LFRLTKRLHNLMHGAGQRRLNSDDRALYAAVSGRLAKAFRGRLKPNDLLVVNDPQPLGMGALLKRKLGLPCIWRCHIGLEEDTSPTREAWAFLKPWAQSYDRTIITLEEYVPPFLAERTQIIHPAIDPLSHKNRELSPHKLTGILGRAALIAHPNSSSPFEAPALRLQRDGSFAPAVHPEDFGLLFRPIVAQISRWDHLKGYVPLLRGFVHLKEKRRALQRSVQHRRHLDSARLVLAGPNPGGVQDDPEAQEVLKETSSLWTKLGPELQRDIVVLKLPMSSPEANALMVNALQRCSSVVAQNALREGFGLTVTEAMWKSRPVLGTLAAGIRSQVLDGREGRLVRDPENPVEIAAMLDETSGTRRGVKPMAATAGSVSPRTSLYSRRSVDGWRCCYLMLRREAVTKQRKFRYGHPERIATATCKVVDLPAWTLAQVRSPPGGVGPGCSSSVRVTLKRGTRQKRSQCERRSNVKACGSLPKRRW
jgi:trehalose synthase